MLASSAFSLPVSLLLLLSSSYFFPRASSIAASPSACAAAEAYALFALSSASLVLSIASEAAFCAAVRAVTPTVSAPTRPRTAPMGLVFIAVLSASCEAVSLSVIALSAVNPATRELISPPMDIPTLKPTMAPAAPATASLFLSTHSVRFLRSFTPCFIICPADLAIASSSPLSAICLISASRSSAASVRLSTAGRASAPTIFAICPPFALSRSISSLKPWSLSSVV